ncbi:MAG TPA: site-2 protease family protein [Capsulimonadaceae bacterium]
MTDNNPNTDEQKKQPATDRDGGSIHIATVSGIPIRIHFTFVILLVFLFLSGAGGGVSNAFAGLAFVVAVFSCVVLHELGHSLVAQRYGIKVASITLYPIGGLARIVQRPTPKQEFWIALAGPAVNVVIAAILAGFGARLGVDGGSGDLLQMLFTANVVLAAFNMIPAFPMDGGRVLRAILAIVGLPYPAATRLAANIGQMLAIGACVVAIYYQQYMWMFIAFFVYLGAGQEAAAVQQEAAFAGLPVTKVMETEVQTLTPGDTLKSAADRLLASAQRDFPVVLGDEVLGLLTRDRLLMALASAGPDTFIAGVMERNFARAQLDEDMGRIISDLANQAPGNRNLPLIVFSGEKMVGMVTGENLTEYFAIQKVLKGRHA